MRAAPAAGWNASQPLGRGGNAVRGVGESFSANPALGMATLTIPVPISSGRSGFSPAGSLVYDAGAGNGIFGIGWAFASSAIVRRTDRGLPTYDDAADSDAFVLSGQDELVPALVDTGDGWIRDERVEGGHQVRRYRSRTEGSFGPDRALDERRRRGPLAGHHFGQRDVDLRSVGRGADRRPGQREPRLQLAAR